MQSQDVIYKLRKLGTTNVRTSSIIKTRIGIIKASFWKHKTVLRRSFNVEIKKLLKTTKKFTNGYQCTV